MRTLVWTIRVAVLGLLTALIIRPTITVHDQNLSKGWAILVDNSRSMRVSDPKKRMDQAKDIVRSLLDILPSKKVFIFSKETKEIKAEDVASIQPLGLTTNGGQALSTVFGEADYEGAFLVTDGHFLGQDDPVAVASRLGKPLFLVGVGDKSLFKDISLDRVQAPPFAFKNISTTINASLSARGYQGKNITVKLREGDNVIALQTVDIRSNEIQTTVSFSWIPEALGSHYLMVEVTAFPDEVTTLNNRREVSVDVGRDRFRVLYISGEPGPEYGFLRHQFKSDPGVELVTFVILRNNTNILNIPEHELSLIPFPTQDVLVNQMSTFDLVVFEEFPYWVYGLSPMILEAIHRRVVQGGSFLLMGGPAVFNPGTGYKISSVEDMIPVKFGDTPIQRSEGAVPFLPKSTIHPIFRIAQNEKQNEDVWKNAPLLEDVAFVAGAKPGASVLAVTRVNGKEYPVLTVAHLGKGRVAVLTARSTWRWAMAEGKKGNDSTLYQNFWKNVVLWLTHSADYKTVRVALEEKELKNGDKGTARVWVYDDYFKPIDADVHLRLVDGNKKETTLSASPETKGVYIAEVPPLDVGNYTLEAWVTRNGKKYGQDSAKIRVVENQSEEEDLRPDFQTLREMAAVCNGRFLPASDFDKPSVEDFLRKSMENQGRKVLLWNSPWYFVCLIFLILFEWSVRKWRGWL